MTYDPHYNRRRLTAIRNGTWLYQVPGEVVAAHIATCRQAGMSVADIARESRLPRDSVCRLPRRTYVGGTVAAAILSVVPRKSLPAGRVDAVRARRKLQALVAIGHPIKDLVCRLNSPHRQVRELVHERRHTILVATDQAVGCLFENLCWTAGPSEQARQVAAGHGWYSPAAWDDIDDPTDRPSIHARGLQCARGHDLDVHRQTVNGHTRCGECSRMVRRGRRQHGRTRRQLQEVVA